MASTSPRAWRNRHGRGRPEVLFPHRLPRWRSPRQRFDDLVLRVAQDLIRRWPALGEVEYGVEDVPPSDPAPWEANAVVLGRVFGADPGAKLPARVVIYRRPCEQRSPSSRELLELVRSVLIEQSAVILGKHPDDMENPW